MKCTAKHGQCKAYAIKGGTVCRVHGGSAPQVKAKAALRLAALIDPELPRVAERIKEGLDAMETKFFQKDGIVTDSRDVVAWSERRGYIETAMKALQIVVDKASSDQPGAIQVNIHVIGS